MPTDEQEGQIPGGNISQTGGVPTQPTEPAEDTSADESNGEGEGSESEGSDEGSSAA